MLVVIVLFWEFYMCVQCKMDFMCCWWEEKSGVIMCENCMIINQKKVFKVEYISWLKVVFVKVLQQEQEIEQWFLQQGMVFVQVKVEFIVVLYFVLKQVIKFWCKLVFCLGEVCDWSNGVVLQVFSQLFWGLVMMF